MMLAQRFYKWFNTEDFLSLVIIFGSFGVVLIYWSVIEYYSISDAMIREAVLSIYPNSVVLIGFVLLVCLFLALARFVTDFQAMSIIKKNDIAVIK